MVIMIKMVMNISTVDHHHHHLHLQTWLVPWLSGFGDSDLGCSRGATLEEGDVLILAATLYAIQRPSPDRASRGTEHACMHASMNACR